MTAKTRADAGKLLVGRLAGTTITAPERELLESGYVGGITIFRENAASFAQLSSLIADVRNILGDDAIIAVDQEGGAVQRLDLVATPLPSPMALAALSDEDSCARVAEISARDLRSLGFNCVFSPVLDLATNPLNPIIATRAFGSRPELASRLGKLTAEVFLKFGVLPVGKHFPGHGDTLEDSHSSLAIANSTREVLDSRELKPFRACLDVLPAVMTGHLWLPAFEQEPMPASLSRRLTQELLREELGFKGLVMTDDVPVMKAITDRFGLPQASAMALRAGADVVLASGSVEQIHQMYSGLIDGIDSGQLNDAIEKALERRRVFLQVLRQTTLTRPDLTESLSVVRTISARSVTVVSGVVPKVRTARRLVIFAPRHPRYSLNLAECMSRSTDKDACAIEEVRYPLSPTNQEIDELLASITFAVDSAVVVVTYRGLLNKGQLELSNKISRRAREARVESLTVIACDAPFELKDIDGFDCKLATCDPSDLAMSALSDVLLGIIRPEGVLPV